MTARRATALSGSRFSGDVALPGKPFAAEAAPTMSDPLLAQGA